MHATVANEDDLVTACMCVPLVPVGRASRPEGGSAMDAGTGMGMGGTEAGCSLCQPAVRPCTWKDQHAFSRVHYPVT